MNLPSTPSKVPFIDITRYEPGFLEALVPRVQNLLRQAQFLGGPEVTALENTLASDSHVRHALACANGTDALQLALRAAGLGRGDTVLLPDMTFWASFEAVVNVGATPVTVDVDPKTLHLDWDLLQEAIERYRPQGLLLVHLYGWAAPKTAAIRKLCQDKGIRLIEDSAQAYGVKLEGKNLIAGAEISTTSFYPAKVLGASGDAGAVFTNSEALAKRVNGLRNHGRADHYHHDQIGWNSRIGAYEACFLNESLKHLPARLESRRQICERYRQELQGLPVKILGPTEGVWENGYCSVGWCEASEREKFLAHLSKAGIDHRVIYPGAMSRQPGATSALGGKLDRGQADLVARSVFSLPCFAYMRDDECERVIEVVKSYFGKA